MFTYAIVLLTILIISWYFDIFKFYESYYDANSVKPIRLRRWRDSVPTNNALGGSDTLRQVQDDWWDRAYNSGRGFQLY